MAGLSSLVYDPSNKVTNLDSDPRATQDANFTINGFAATSASNIGEPARSAA